MRPTRRLWATFVLAGSLGALAVVYGHVLLLVGSILVGTWLLSRQAAFLNEVVSVDRALIVDQSPEDTSLRDGEDSPFSISAALPEPTKQELTVTPGVPLAAQASNPGTLYLGGQRTEVTTTIDLEWPISGNHQFDQATVTAEDGLFIETFESGTTPNVTVEPKGITDVHVGAGGRRLDVAYGEHKTERTGPGIEPARIREYVPGDPADWIDWKTTARHQEMYVHDFEVETDRGTWIVLDTRASLSDGPEGETKFDHLRSVALGILQSARAADDPIGLLVIDEEGIRSVVTPSTDPEAQRTVRRQLLSVSPDSTDEETRAGLARRHPTLASDARTLAATLDDESTRFARTLRPFLTDHGSYHRRIATTPLYAGVTEALASTEGIGLIAIFTDDEHIAELTETIKRARGAGQDVLACIAPAVLYGATTDHADAYSEYVDFEDHRRRLSAMNRVTALEVGPRDRISQLLAKAQRGRRSEAVSI